MSELDFFSVVRKQRACRRFSDQEVSDLLIEKILAAATFAPSAENSQPWIFVVVKNQALRVQLHNLAKKAWAAGGRDSAVTRLDKKLLAEVDDGISGGGYATAPVMVLVAADTERVHPQVIAASILPAVQNILLAATALELGSALTTITMGFTAEIQTMLGLPATHVPQALIPIGFPYQPLGLPRRELFNEHTYRDSFDNPWSG